MTTGVLRRNDVMLHGVNAEPAVAAESRTVVRGDKEVPHGLSFTVPAAGPHRCRSRGSR